MTLLDATTPSESGPGNNDNEWFLYIPRRETRDSSCDGLMPYWIKVLVNISAQLIYIYIYIYIY